MKSTVFSSSQCLWVRWKWFRAPHPRFVFDGAEDVVDGDLEWCEVSLLSVDLRGVLWGPFVDCGKSSILILHWEGKFWLRLLPLIPLLEERSIVLLVTSSICMLFEHMIGCLSSW